MSNNTLIARIRTSLASARSGECSATALSESMRGNGHALERMPYQLIKELDSLAMDLEIASSADEDGFLSDLASIYSQVENWLNELPTDRLIKQEPAIFHSKVLARWFELAADDSVLKDSADINAEANENLWSFSPSEQEDNKITSEELQLFVFAIMDNRRRWLRQHALSDMTFYCWHDFQARAIRFSLVSSSHSRLPFGCKTKMVTDLLTITQHIVDRDWNNDCIFEWTNDDTGSVAEQAQQVWTQVLN
jgi:hypothetical protein